MKTIRIANGQGFWGDMLEAPVRQVEAGPLDYLTLDYLAEVTMSIMQKQRSRNPDARLRDGLRALMTRILPQLVVERGIKVVANAGRRESRGVHGSGAAVVSRTLGLQRASPSASSTAMTSSTASTTLIARGERFANMDTGEPLSTVRDRVTRAPTSISARARSSRRSTAARRSSSRAAAPIPGLALGSDDPRVRLEARRLGPPRRRHRSPATSSSAARSAPAATAPTGSRSPTWRTSAIRLSRPTPNGDVRHHQALGTGGRVTRAVIKEQLVYEMGDPHEYITPDCSGRFHHAPALARRRRPRAALRDSRPA